MVRFFATRSNIAASANLAKQIMHKHQLNAMKYNEHLICIHMHSYMRHSFYIILLHFKSSQETPSISFSLPFHCIHCKATCGLWTLSRISDRCRHDDNSWAKTGFRTLLDASSHQGSLQFPRAILTYDSKCKPYHLHSPSYHVDKVCQRLIRSSPLQFAPGFWPRLSSLQNAPILLLQILKSYNLPMGSQKVGNPSKPFL